MWYTVETLKWQVWKKKGQNNEIKKSKFYDKENLHLKKKSQYNEIKSLKNEIKSHNNEIQSCYEMKNWQNKITKFWHCEIKSWQFEKYNWNLYIRKVKIMGKKLKIEVKGWNDETISFDYEIITGKIWEK